MSLTELVIKFTHLGAEWVMWVLVLLSIVSVTVMIERVLFFRRHRIDSDKLATDLETHLRPGDLPGAPRLVKDSRAAGCAVAAAGLSYFNRSSLPLRADAKARKPARS